MQSIACAVVHEDPPAVFVAEDIETLNWVIALRLIAVTPSTDLQPVLREDLRTALLEERWGDAVELWMGFCPGVIDVYPSYDFFTAHDVALAAQELQFKPLFRD